MRQDGDDLTDFRPAYRLPDTDDDMFMWHDFAAGEPRRRALGAIGTAGVGDIRYTDQGPWHPELRWPNVWQSVYKKIHRSDPEVAVTRHAYNVWGRAAEIMVELPPNPTTDEKRLGEFYEQVLDDVGGGIQLWQEMAVTNTPFVGWSMFEIVPGIRREGWRPPDGDDWESVYNDGMFGVRRLAWRDYSSFFEWRLDERRRNIIAYGQLDSPFPVVYIPYDRCLHLTFGSSASPYGLSPYEALWRLARYKFDLELVFGIGVEKAAGHLSVHLDRTPSATDLQNIKTAAQNVLKATQGNYAVWPSGVKDAKVVDATFTAAESLLEAIRFYHLLKLQVLFGSQWIAVSSTAQSGTYSAAESSIKAALGIFNAIFKTIVSQFDNRLGPLLLRWNKKSFGADVRRPRFVAREVKQDISPTELSQLIAMISPIMGFGAEDMIEIRKQTGFLPLAIPDKLIHDPDRAANAPKLRKDAPKPQTQSDKQEEEADNTTDDETDMSLGVVNALAKLIQEQDRETAKEKVRSSSD